MSGFIKKFQNQVFHKKIFERESGIILGVSGGPDSVCLLTIFSLLKDKYHLKLKVCHVNYGLRGKYSDGDENFVKKLAMKSNLEFSGVKFFQKDNSKQNPEESMREFRYDFFEKERQKSGFDYIAVGHNLDDRVETFFLNLLRGTGSGGLVSLREKNNKVIRPLLIFSRKEILEFLKSQKQKYRVDQTNQDEKYTRNRIRKVLIPLLEKKFNPKLKKRISDLEDNLLVANLAEKEYSKLLMKKVDWKNLSFDLVKMSKLNDWQKQLVLRQACREAKGNLRNFSRAHIFELEKVIRGYKSIDKEIFISDLRVGISKGRVRFSNQQT